MSMWEEITEGGGGAGGGKKRWLIIGGIGVFVFVAVRKMAGGSTASAPADQSYTEPNPQVTDIPTYANMNQQDLDQQFQNYQAIIQQDTTNKFMSLNDSLTSMQQHMDLQNSALQNQIASGLAKTTVSNTVNSPLPVTPAPATASSKPTGIQLMSAGTHYATPRGGWNPNSIVDYLKQGGYKSDIASRSKYAQESGISGYHGTAQQNVQLLKSIKAQK
jgi:hypothetical protein